MQQFNVKVCFVVDCTASMEPWIRQAKTRMVELVDRIREEHTNARVRVGFVGYRDYGDKKQIVEIPFQSARATMSQIQDVQAEGGDDQAEDVAHALFRALHMDWSNSDVKVLFHIADAPAHGNMFHTIHVSDRYPRGDPDGLDPRDSVEKLSFLGVNYTFVRIDSSTDRMVEEFQKCYMNGGTFSVIDLLSQGRDNGVGDPEELNDELTKSVRMSITNYTISQEL